VDVGVDGTGVRVAVVGIDVNVEVGTTGVVVEGNVGMISGVGAGAQEASNKKRERTMESASLLANCKG